MGQNITNEPFFHYCCAETLKIPSSQPKSSTGKREAEVQNALNPVFGPSAWAFD
jgi:hypothetical protein